MPSPQSALSVKIAVDHHHRHVLLQHQSHAFHRHHYVHHLHHHVDHRHHRVNQAHHVHHHVIIMSC